MPSLKAIRTRIASVKNTQKITKAMKLVAAARLRRAQDAIVAARPYAKRLTEVLGDVTARLSLEAGEESHPLLAQAADEGRAHHRHLGRPRPGRRLQLEPGAPPRALPRRREAQLPAGGAGHRRAKGARALEAAPGADDAVRRTSSSSPSTRRRRRRRRSSARASWPSRRPRTTSTARSTRCSWPSTSSRAPSRRSCSIEHAAADRAGQAARRRHRASTSSTSRPRATCSRRWCRCTSRSRCSARCSSRSPRSSARRCPRWTTRPRTPRR